MAVAPFPTLLRRVFRSNDRERSMRVIATPVMLAATLSSALAAEGGFPPFESHTFVGQIFWLAITFGLLYLLMSRIALPRIGTILEQRQHTIETALAAASKAQQGAEAEAAALEQALTKARTDAQAIAAEARATSAREIDARRQAVESTLSAKMVAAEADISAAKVKAMASVTGIAREATSAMIERLTGTAPAAASVDQALATAGGE
jgi:F-type H+-transporting ATPase subunit b